MNVNQNSRNRQRFVIFVLLLIVMCAGVSIAISNWVMHDQQWKHDAPHGHDWLHQELGLTDAEAARVDAFEAKYRGQRAELLEQFNQKIAELAELLRTNDSLSSEVTHAVHDLHQVHGELQNLSIQHYYEMLSVLPPDKQTKLRDIAVEALSTPQ